LTKLDDTDGSATGVRERKRLETRQRISDAGLRLFAAQGYEATTLDAIAAEAGISRRTFFHYFKSKDEILLSMQRGLGDTLVEALEKQSPRSTPLEASRSALKSIVAPYSNERLLEIDKLMRASEAVQGRKQAAYLQDEAMVFATLRKMWPAETDIALRLVASLTINTVRLTLDTWSGEGGKRPISEVLTEAFEALDALYKRR
jgi:AcrR family transcriptional regulator